MNNLATKNKFLENARSNWHHFLERRQSRLKQLQRVGGGSEKIAENILEDLFTLVLSWSLSDINNQIKYADIVITKLGIKQLIMEIKRPGALVWNRQAVEQALAQARRYADQQKVKTIAISDGTMLYAVDIQHGGLHDRLFVSLDSQEFPEELWYLSEHGIYRVPKDIEKAKLKLLADNGRMSDVNIQSMDNELLLHPKYKIPATCFAYVGNANNVKTWKLPYKLDNGKIDTKRLPKAIQCVLTNYRGAKVSDIPEQAIPKILLQLEQAAISLGKMPHQTNKPSQAYCKLAIALQQFKDRGI